MVITKRPMSDAWQRHLATFRTSVSARGLTSRECMRAASVSYRGVKKEKVLVQIEISVQLASDSSDFDLTTPDGKKRAAALKDYLPGLVTLQAAQKYARKSNLHLSGGPRNFVIRYVAQHVSRFDNATFQRHVQRIFGGASPKVTSTYTAKKSA